MIRLLGVVAVIAFAIWAVRRLLAAQRTVQSDDIDTDELEAAERAVRDADGPDDGDGDADWGPGAPRR